MLLRETKQMSHFRSRKDWEGATWKKLIVVIKKCDSLPDLALLLEVLVSAPERQRIIMRAAAIARLLEGKSYRTIGEELWLSPQTISAIRKGFTERRYISRWTRDSHRDREKKRKANLRRIAERDARDAATRPYRRTKYGKFYY